MCNFPTDEEQATANAAVKIQVTVSQAAGLLSF